jgi:hypothetical protein
MLFVGQKLGREEDSETSDACPGAFRTRLEKVESEVAVPTENSVHMCLPRIPSLSTNILVAR